MIRCAGIDVKFNAHVNFKEGNPMKQSNALAYLRQLCCSGLSKEIVIPEFLRAVKTVLPSGSNTFTGFDEQLKPAYLMLEFVAADMDERTPFGISGFFTPERRSRAAVLSSQQPVLTDLIFLDEPFYRSDLYSLIYRRFDQYHCLCAPVMQKGKPAGMLNLFRPRQQKPFDNCEQVLFTHLLTYVAYALQAPDNKDIQYSENGSSGMMIMDTQGIILSLSHEAKKLLALACHPILTVDARSKEVELLAKLSQLCGNLEAVSRGQQTAPPCWCYTGANGRFMFRAYWLDRQNNEPGGLIGMTIEHQEPLVLKILRALQNQPLPPTQKEVALLLAQGAPSDKIGERLHIKLTTVKDHVGKIFTKLDLHHREELLPKLLALDSSNISCIQDQLLLAGTGSLLESATRKESML
jgi:DNA-binding CsgD family transcriptional regulator